MSRSSNLSNLVISLVVLAIHLDSCFSSSSKWSYETGEEHWTKIAQDCSGKSQSPIDIQVSEVKVDPSLDLTLKGYGQPIDGSSFLLSNNGHTVQLGLIFSSLTDEEVPIIKGSALNGMTYKFVQLHFHWHDNDTAGSEHAIDGKRYALEVTYQSTLCKCYSM